jgi:dephospho-CoA kinase
LILLGLTGSIGMGKTTTARLFEAEGVPVYDADAAVHALYSKGGAAVEAVEALFPGVTADGAVDRARLGEKVLSDPAALKRLEAVVHPMAAAARAGFFERARQAGAGVVVLDVPLLFETGGDGQMDAVAVVSAPAEVQRERVLARPGMTEAKLDAILARQMPDAEKRERADFVIDAGQGLDVARAQVRGVLARLAEPGWTGNRLEADED